MTELATPNTKDPLETAYHYQVIARAIAAIDAAGAAPLPLEDLAREVGLSPAHLQRLFSKWAGISPKRYQQFLTLGHAKTLLKERRSLLDTSNSLGLSGSARLHDLFITWEAMTPGDFATGGAGQTIRLGWTDSPYGPALFALTERGICGLGFQGEMSREEADSDMRKRWPNARFTTDTEAAARAASQVFAGKGKAHLTLIGAPFQIKVWQALLSIKDGEVTTYGDIAARIDAPKAARAVGTAIGQNPIGYLIPCHRALRATGELGGYHWGLPIKRAILADETARTAHSPA